jgi:hypothetical protein
MPAHVIQARLKAAERVGHGPFPTTPAAAGPVGPDPVTGLHPTPEPDPATELDPLTERSPKARSQPHWRALLEARWQARLRQITELSLAYHDAAATGAHQSGDHAAAKLRDILRRTVATRRALADIEEGAGPAASARGCVSAYDHRPDNDRRSGEPAPMQTRAASVCTNTARVTHPTTRGATRRAGVRGRGGQEVEQGGH